MEEVGRASPAGSRQRAPPTVRLAAKGCVVAEALREEFPKVFQMITDADGASVLLRAVQSYWRSQELPKTEALVAVDVAAVGADATARGACEEEEDEVGVLKWLLTRLLVYLRGELQNALEVRTSLLLGAGQGLFVRRPVVEGEWLCVYSGTLVSFAALVKAKERGDPPSDYVMGGFGVYSVDAAAHPDVMARYANDPYEAPEHRNSHFVKLKGPKKAILVAKRDLEVGSELYVDYGAGFWRARGVASAMPPSTAEPASATATVAFASLAAVAPQSTVVGAASDGRGGNGGRGGGGCDAEGAVEQFA
mmetsp:Transcript_46929/g.120694  ORF Transcript_46929/g.120694 Transcript_46929/m.120694 type:complete len:307 (+) Transcript_46929:101-1021(+)